MSWYVIYKTATGERVSDTSTQPDAKEQTAMGNSIATLADQPDWGTQQWRSTAHDVADIPPVGQDAIFSTVGRLFAIWQVHKTAHDAFVTANEPDLNLRNSAATQERDAYAAFKAAYKDFVGL